MKILTQRIIASAVLAASLAAAPIAEARHGRNTAFVAGALTGAILSNAARADDRHYRRSHRHHRRHYRGGYRAAKRRCAARYRSYDWDSDTYVDYDGRVRTCRYVRPYL